MTETLHDSIHLHRIDASRNMARFYRVTIETTLFGETMVRRCWGRLGTRGQSLSLVVQSQTDARLLLGEIESRKRRRGYREPGR